MASFDGLLMLVLTYAVIALGAWAFIDALDPHIAVISVGQPNPYGHPNPDALAELDGVGAQIWRTDQRGTITISFTGQGPVVASER